MKTLTILLILVIIGFLWLVANVMHKPTLDQFSVMYHEDKDGIRIANICVSIMLALAFVIGLLF